MKSQPKRRHAPNVDGHMPSEYAAMYIVDYLNDPDRSEAEKTVLSQFIEDFKKLLRSTQKKHSVDDRGRLVRSTAIDLLHRINRQLPDEYWKRKQIVWWSQKEGTLTFNCGPLTPAGSVGVSLKAIVFDLARQGLLWKVGKCASCKRPIYRRRKTDKFCLDSGCRQAYDGQTPHGKALHNVRQKNYRKREKQRDEKVLKKARE